MAFDSTNLWNKGGFPPGSATYLYVSDTDTRETVMASGYFNNTDDNQNFAVDDVIYVVGDAGFYKLRVDTVSSGTVTTEYAGPTIWIPVRIASLAATTSYWAVSPCDGTINRVKSVIEGAVSADTTLGLELAGTDVTDGGSAALITITASGSAAGDVDTGEADAANAVSEGTAIEVTCGGEGSTASAGMMFIEIIPA